MVEEIHDSAGFEETGCIFGWRMLEDALDGRCLGWLYNCCFSILGKLGLGAGVSSFSLIVNIWTGGCCGPGRFSFL